MIALLRYLLLKGWREQSIQPMVIAPCVLTGAPILVLMIVDVLRGRFRYPFAVSGTSSQSTAALFLILAAGASALIAGVSGFSAFRAEIANHSIGSLVLASRARLIVSAAVLYGVVIGLAAATLGAGAACLATGAVPRNLLQIAKVMALICPFAAALAVALASYSSDYGALIPFWFATLFLFGFLVDALSPLNAAGTAIAAILFGATATFLLERRCIT